MAPGSGPPDDDSRRIEALLMAAQDVVGRTGAGSGPSDPRDVLGGLLDRTACLVEPAERRDVAQDWINELDVDSVQQLVPLLQPNPFGPDSPTRED